MSRDKIIGCIKKGLETIGLEIDVSDLELYFDGLAEEMFTASGTAVYRCPVWYGGIYHKDKESVTFSVYEITDAKICISLRRFLPNSCVSTKDLFEIASA